MNYFIHPDAETELGDAAEFYAVNASADCNDIRCKWQRWLQMPWQREGEAG